MTNEEIIDELNNMRHPCDVENIHSRADDLVVKALRLNGLSEIAEAFTEALDRVGFWYA